MDPVPIVDAEIGMLLLIFNAHPANLSQWVELADTNITTTLYVTKVSSTYVQSGSYMYIVNLERYKNSSPFAMSEQYK